jgi:uncharacterized RDD family membrane protein YckC
LDRQWQSLLSFGGLALIMLAIFSRRHESILNAVVPPPGTLLATHARRILAFMLDAAFCSPLVLTAIYGTALACHIDLWTVIPEYAVSAVGTAEPIWLQLFWPWAAGCAVFCIYGVVFEWRWSATPGKRVFKCRVISEDGTPSKKSAILWRNAARFVEFFLPFQFLPVIVLVLLTRNRQRLGDLIARTLVVEVLDEFPESTPSAPIPPERPEGEQGNDK